MPELVRHEGYRQPAQLLRLLHLNARYLLFFAADRLRDCWYGIDTSTGLRGYTSLDGLEIAGDREAANSYTPTPYGTLHRLFAALPFDLSDWSFIDFGSGKGRALIVAARYPFKQVIGVEFAAALHQAAERNIAKLAKAGRNRVRSVECDARDFEIPDGPCVLFFFNPFGREVMNRVAHNVASSLADDPRMMVIALYNKTVGGIFELLAGFHPVAAVREGWVDSLSHRGRYSIDILATSPAHWQRPGRARLAGST